MHIDVMLLNGISLSQGSCFIITYKPLTGIVAIWKINEPKKKLLSWEKLLGPIITSIHLCDIRERICMQALLFSSILKALMLKAREKQEGAGFLFCSDLTLSLLQLLRPVLCM